MKETRTSLPPTLHINGQIARICLRRPEQANRLEPEDLDLLLDYCAQLGARPELRAIVLESCGRYFSAGFDIRRIVDISSQSTAETLENPFEAVIDAFERLPQPTVARLHGGVYGGSTDLALACDFRIGTPDTEMFMPAAALGLLYYPSGICRFTSRLGVQAAKELFLLGEKIDAEKMLSIGFLSEIVESQALDERITAITDRLIAQAPLAVQGAKRAINDLASNEFDRHAFKLKEAQVLRSEDLKEGLNAWAEKRKPVFVGR